MYSEVIIQFEIEGFHQYNDAPLKVDFLKHNHRHTFIIKAGYQVTDLNREKEIFLERDLIKCYLEEAYGVPCQFDDMSCEMIAKDVLEFAKIDGMKWCEVWEENTGGAKVSLS